MQRALALTMGLAMTGRWSKAEDERVEARVAEEMGDDPLRNRRRGMRDIWRSIDQDSSEQQALHLDEDLAEECIVVNM